MTSRDLMVCMTPTSFQFMTCIKACNYEAARAHHNVVNCFYV